MTDIDPIGDTSRFPYYHELCEALRTKYNIPLKIDWASGALYNDFMNVVENTKTWLTTNYKKECGELTCPYKQGNSAFAMPDARGLSDWMRAKVSPTPFYGAQQRWESSTPGQMAMTTTALCEAYRICHQKSEEEKARVPAIMALYDEAYKRRVQAYEQATAELISVLAQEKQLNTEYNTKRDEAERLWMDGKEWINQELEARSISEKIKKIRGNIGMIKARVEKYDTLKTSMRGIVEYLVAREASVLAARHVLYNEEECLKYAKRIRAK